MMVRSSRYFQRSYESAVGVEHAGKKKSGSQQGLGDDHGRNQPAFDGLATQHASILQDITLTANGMDQLPIGAIIQLTPQAGDVHFDHIAEFFPVVVVEMFQQLSF